MMKLWNLVRQWLVVQALMTWMGGFFFYSAIVVPTGTDEIGAFTQGLITRVVTSWMNLIGILALVLFAWDQWAVGKSRFRWVCWGVMAVGLVGLFVLHPMLSRHVDLANKEEIRDFDAFYPLHQTYLAIITVIWGASLLWLALTLKVWSAPTTANQPLGTDKAP